MPVGLFEFAADQSRKLCPNNFAEQVAAPEQLFGLRVEVSELPIAVECEKTLGDALEDLAVSLAEASDLRLGSFAVRDVSKNERDLAFGRVADTERVNVEPTPFCDDK